MSSACSKISFSPVSEVQNHIEGQNKCDVHVYTCIWWQTEMHISKGLEYMYQMIWFICLWSCNVAIRNRHMNCKAYT